ncbi:helix-hairpin-helix domain-containing protein [Enterococcus sp. LJL128]|uniref:hypothetical protein n=1 Tax=Enterococcus sp. LJL51 TaxID=3416656 RepID=UPI003CF67615
MTYQEFLEKLSKPARRALLHKKIDSFPKLAALTKKELLSFHGIGPASLPIVNQALHSVNMSLKQ